MFRKNEFWPSERGGGGGCGQNICYHVAAMAIPFNLICNMFLFLKMLNFNLLTPRVEGGGGLQAFFFLLPCCCTRDSL